MKTIEQIVQLPNLLIDEIAKSGLRAWAKLEATTNSCEVFIQASWGYGWDHVSASFEDRTPTWEEMAEIKAMFFRDDETVVQFHPKRSEYVNTHPYCLHIWRNQCCEHELPPWWLTGIKEGKTEWDVLRAVKAYEIKEGLKKKMRWWTRWWRRNTRIR
ncbi:MAG: DUF7694 domain-containing protein [Candidatus Nanosyncoccaceae bacterium]|jgi:hypothetical protein